MPNTLIHSKNYIQILEELLNQDIRDLCIAMYLVSPGAFLAGKESPYGRLMERLKSIRPAHGPARIILPGEIHGYPHTYLNQKAKRDFAQNGWLVREGPKAACMHAKLWIFNNSEIVLGSHNISLASAMENHDLSVHINDLPTVAEAVNWFHDLWNVSKPITQ